VNILAIDQGTSATKALLVGPGQQVLGTGEVPVRPRAGGDAIEVDPEELLSSVLAAGRFLPGIGTQAGRSRGRSAGKTVGLPPSARAFLRTAIG
jgi:hypothetical protein